MKVVKRGERIRFDTGHSRLNIRGGTMKTANSASLVYFAAIGLIRAENAEDICE